MNLSKEIASMYDDAVRIRQDLHRIPEIGFQLHDTQAYVLNELRQCAPDRLETLAVCGVKAVFFAKDAQKTIALRADMDGIHNDEANDVPYQDPHPGWQRAHLGRELSAYRSVRQQLRMGRSRFQICR